MVLTSRVLICVLIGITELGKILARSGGQVNIELESEGEPAGQADQ